MTYILYLYDEEMRECVEWLNDLKGKSCVAGRIKSVVDWQVVYNGRPYHFTAIARVEVEA